MTVTIERLRASSWEEEDELEDIVEEQEEDTADRFWKEVEKMLKEGGWEEIKKMEEKTRPSAQKLKEYLKDTRLERQN